MIEAPMRSLDRHPALAAAARYVREVAAPIASVWENVHDWEHLPWLHAQAFRSISLRSSGDWGWHADVGFPGDAAADVEVVIDHAASCYVARTRMEGEVRGETWTRLTPLPEDRTGVEVDFLLPEASADTLAEAGAAMVALYTGLWDQDEEMIRVRDATRPSGTRSEGKPTSLDLGDWASLRSSLPRVFEFAGARFVLALHEGEPIVYAAECPHWRGPLEACEIEEDGSIVCPWHGYRFDAVRGRSLDGRGLRLRPPPRFEIDSSSGEARLVSR